MNVSNSFTGSARKVATGQDTMLLTEAAMLSFHPPSLSLHAPADPWSLPLCTCTCVVHVHMSHFALLHPCGSCPGPPHLKMLIIK